MAEKINNRDGTYMNHCASIYYSFRNSEQLFGARLLSTSQGGICFQTGYAIRPGREIFIFRDQPLTETPIDEISDARLARVQWCDNIPDCDAFFYRIGVKFV